MAKPLRTVLFVLIGTAISSAVVIGLQIQPQSTHSLGNETGSLTHSTEQALSFAPVRTKKDHHQTLSEPFIVHGVFKASSPLEKSAILVNLNGVGSRIVKEGEPLLLDLTLREVMETAIVVEKGGESRLIKISIRPDSSDALSEQPLGFDDSAEEYIEDEEEVSDTLTNPEGFFAEVQLSYVDSEEAHFLVNGLQQDSHQLKNGDKIFRINDQYAESLASDLYSFSRGFSNVPVHFDIEREGQRLSIFIERW